MTGEALTRRSFEMAADLTAPRAARVFVRDVLGAEPLPPPPLPLDSIELVVSEFVTNAILHGRPPIRLSVTRTCDSLRVEVVDDGPGVPAVRDPTWFSTSGRGLRIVDLLAARWGIDVLPRGKVVWAEFVVRENR